MRLAAALILALALPAEATEPMQPITRDSAQAWSFLSDRVMGGISEGHADFSEDDGQGLLRLSGTVSTANRGGFIQMRCDIDIPPGAQGLVLRVRGDGQRYYVHLRMHGLRMPWQFYQAPFETTADWREIRIPFTAFRPKGGFQRATPRPDAVESLGIAAYGRDQSADVMLSGLGFY